LVTGRLDVCRILQRQLNERTPFIFNAAVVGTNQLNQIALRLVRNHFKTLVKCLRSVESFTISWPFGHRQLSREQEESHAEPGVS